jgi:hypothetical protein
VNLDGGSRGGQVIRALRVGTLRVGIAIAAVLFVVTGGHVLFLPLLLITFGGLAWRRTRQ